MARVRLARLPAELIAMGDCWVNDFPQNVDENLNGDGLGIGRWDALNRGLVKFELRDVGIEKEEVTAAELLLYGKALFTPLVVEAHYTATGWDEETVTWNNQPPPTIHHWEGGDTSLMGSTTDVPSVAEGWFSIPIDVEFVRHRWGQILSAILMGHEGAEDSYCFTSDREEAGGAYAPRLVLRVGVPPVVPAAAWMLAPALVGVSMIIAVGGGQ